MTGTPPTSTITPADQATARAAELAPSTRLMLSHPAHLLSFGFGSGLARFAPGTWGTLFAWVSFIVLNNWLVDAGWAALIATVFALGAMAAQRTGMVLGRPDHGAIVIDEIVAFWIVLWLLPSGLLTQAAAFIGCAPTSAEPRGRQGCTVIFLDAPTEDGGT